MLREEFQRALRRPLFALLICAALAGCGGDVVVSRAASLSDVAPLISGTPATTVTVGSSYSFVPKAAVTSSGPLAYSIANRPSWATFSIATGALGGTPPDGSAGIYPDIVITVNDGATSMALAPFSITVLASAAGAGSASLSWAPPTRNTDGSQLNNLAGYRIYHGTSAVSLGHVVEVSNPSATSYSVTGLPSGTHYFAMSAYTTGGVESGLSELGSKTIP